MSSAPSPLRKRNKDKTQKLPKKCWREEYIKLLERFEYPPPFQSRLPNPPDTFEKVTLQALVHDLEEAGLICTHELGGISIPNRITYFGRIELERLKSMRCWPRIRHSVWSIAIFVSGVIFRDLWPMVRAHFFSRFLN